MKLSHLSIAILSAITLAACGGGGSSQSLTDTDSGVKPVDQTPVDQTPLQPMEPTIPEQEVIVDPAQTGVVGKLDFKKESSVGTTQYIRNKDSKFDRIDNPSESTSATSIFGVSVNQQNPYLTNIALARLKNSKYPDKTLVQYLGVKGENAADFHDTTSLQQQNKHNVAIERGLTRFAGLQYLKEIEGQLGHISSIIEEYTKQPTLTDAQKKNLEILLAAKKELESVKSEYAAGNGPDKDKGVTLVDRATSAKVYWGDGIKTPENVLSTANAKDDPVSTADDRPLSVGLVGINVSPDERSPTAYKAKNLRVHGTEEYSESSTRIFGRNYSYKGNDKSGSVQNTPNSYSGATTVIATGDLTNFSKRGRSAFADIDKEVTKSKQTIKWTLAAKPAELAYVQYGRVTGNLDPEDFSEEQIKSGDKLNYQVRKFLNKGDAGAVDTYFYRGPNATTLEQMNKVATEGKVLTYRGHALMYGIDNEFHNQTPDSVPTAFGKTGMKGVGNFVEAKVDLSKGRLDDGFVYNVWHNENERAVVRDVLVKFDGNIYGNTVIGEAQRAYNKTDKADFRASFFGENAEELGGSFNSTTYQERYGAKGDIWGGVFGAQRTVDTPKDSLSNQQLGDIAPLTTSPSK